MAAERGGRNKRVSFYPHGEWCGEGFLQVHPKLPQTGWESDGRTSLERCRRWRRKVRAWGRRAIFFFIIPATATADKTL